MKKAQKESRVSDDDRHPVGYCNPPRHTRFKPGTSGNPRGKSRRYQDGILTDIIGKELYQPVRIQQDGRTIKLPRIQVAIRRMTVDAMKGLPAAVKGMVQLAQLHDEELAAVKAKPLSMSREEQAQRIMQILTLARAQKEAKDKREKEKQQSDKAPKKPK